MSTSLVLRKGQSLNLSKSVATLLKYAFGLSWDESADLDAVAILLGANGKVLSPDTGNVCYYGNCTGNKYGNPENPVAGLIHSGDARNGAAVGDDETITIDTALLHPEVEKIIIAVTSYSDTDPVPFCASVHPTAKLYDATGKVLFEVKLDESAAFSTCVEFVEIAKVNGDFVLKVLAEPVGSSQANGLVDLMEKYS